MKRSNVTPWFAISRLVRFITESSPTVWSSVITTRKLGLAGALRALVAPVAAPTAQAISSASRASGNVRPRPQLPPERGVEGTDRGGTTGSFKKARLVEDS